jgi:acyl-CoA synthetase (AMP-forming)/AMP-acid ligase II/acyl carrier protein
LAVTTLSFDIAGLELFLPLCVGGKVEIVSREVASDGVRLAEALARSGATVMQATPASWQMLLEAGWQGDKKLKILCGGEALPGALARELLERSASLWNLYGPTETTIWSAVERVEPAGGVIPIGRPIDNTEIYILDPYLNPTPVGVPGELYIGGAGVARGYRNRAELVAERFVPDPFSAEPGARMYRTGDRARYGADGEIEFLGRIDDQVKIRGFRIELGEIETVLRQHVAVREAVVVAREDPPQEPASDENPKSKIENLKFDKRLVAYVVPTRQATSNAKKLRRFLSSQLPHYMLPSAFMFLEALPLTPSGKIDRRALPSPDSSRPDLQEGYVAPRTPVEETIAKIWAGVLKLQRVGIHDNFFDIGGHSLNATQVISRIREAFHLDVPLRSLFEHPTVAGLAASIIESQSEEPDELATLLDELEGLSEEEMRQMTKG